MIALVLLFLCIFCILFVAQTRGTLYFKEKLNIVSGSNLVYPSLENNSLILEYEISLKSLITLFAKE